MFRCDVLDFLLLKGCTSQNLIANQRIEALDQFNQFQWRIGSKSIELASQCNVLVNYALEIKTGAYNFISSSRCCLVTAMCWDKVVTWLSSSRRIWSSLAIWIFFVFFVQILLVVQWIYTIRQLLVFYRNLCLDPCFFKNLVLKLVLLFHMEFTQVLALGFFKDA